MKTFFCTFLALLAAISFMVYAADGAGTALEKEPGKVNISLIRMNADLGSPDAQFNLGVCYEMGNGIGKDISEAVKWYKKSAELGHAGAQYRLGMCYHEGKGVKKDLKKALKWYRNAVERGNIEAKTKLDQVVAVLAQDILKSNSDVTDLSDDILTLSFPKGVKVELARVEAGTFVMSAKDGENRHGEIPHQVTLKHDFFITRTTVTQAQWQAVTGKNPSGYKGDDLPIGMVSWNDAMEFCEKLNTMGLAPKGWHFSLPTETQWEFACLGGNKSKGFKYSGSNNVDEVAWYLRNSGGKTHPVAQKKPNELGLYDMSGNADEWVLDDWQSDSSKQKPEFSRKNDRDGLRLRRGGSWNASAYNCRPADRGNNSPNKPGDRSDGLSFRLVLVPYP